MKTITYPEKLSFRTKKDQLYKGAMGLRLVTYEGKCFTCGANTYRMYDADTGEDNTDCRGPLGEFHTNSNLIPSEYGYSGDEIILCFGCSNRQNTYKMALQQLKTHCTKIEN